MEEEGDGFDIPAVVKPVKTESLEEFLARGGEVTTVSAGKGADVLPEDRPRGWRLQNQISHENYLAKKRGLK